MSLHTSDVLHSLCWCHACPGHPHLDHDSVVSLSRTCRGRSEICPAGGPDMAWAPPQLPAHMPSVSQGVPRIQRRRHGAGARPHGYRCAPAAVQQSAPPAKGRLGSSPILHRSMNAGCQPLRRHDKHPVLVRRARRCGPVLERGTEAAGALRRRQRAVGLHEGGCKRNTHCNGGETPPLGPERARPCLKCPRRRKHACRPHRTCAHPSRVARIPLDLFLALAVAQVIADSDGHVMDRFSLSKPASWNPATRSMPVPVSRKARSITSRWKRTAGLVLSSGFSALVKSAAVA